MTDPAQNARPFKIACAISALIVLATRQDLREVVRDWRHRIDIHIAEADHRPADALLIRPDAYVAWAATNDEPAESAIPGLRDALSDWFGTA